MTDTPIATEVSFNLKSTAGKPKNYKLGLLNLFIGANGTGKTTVSQAVALAVSGAADDVAGRQICSDPSTLMGLAYQRGFDGGKLFARVTLSNEQACEWNTHREGARVKTPTHIKPEWVQPETKDEHSPHLIYREVREVLASNAKAARARLTEWVCDDLDDAAIESELSAPDYKVYVDLTKGLDCSHIDRLTQSIKLAGTRQRQCNADAKASRSLHERLAASVEARVTDAQILAQKENVRQCEAAYEAAVRADAQSGAIRRRKDIESKLTVQRAKVPDLERRIREADRHLASLTEPDPVDGEVQLGQTAMADGLDWAIDSGWDDQCPACSQSVPSGHLQSCRDYYRSAVGDSETGYATYAKAKGAVRDLAFEKASLDRRILELESDLREVPQVVKAEDVDLDETRDLLRQHRDYLATLQRQKTEWAQMDAALKNANESSAEAAVFQGYKAHVQKTIQSLLAQRIEKFCVAVSAYLPDGWDFGVTLDDDGRAVFFYGLYEEDAFGRYLKVGLSEAQRVAVTCAMCAAVNDLRPTPLTIIVPDDRAWDPETLSSVLSALSACKLQILMSSTVQPAEPPPSVWRVFDLDVPEATDQMDLPLPPRREPVVAPPEPPKAPAPPPAVEEEPSAPTPEEVASRPPYDEFLGADPVEMPHGRARGGKIRSAKSRARKYIEKHSRVELDCLVFRNDPTPHFDDDEDFIAKVANYLFPLGVQ